MAYKTNYLKLVIFQLQFDPILELANTSPSEFHKKIIGELPGVQEGYEIEVQTSVIANKSVAKTEVKPDTKITKSRPRWIFTSKDKLKQLAVAEQHFTLVYKQYDDSEATKRDIDFLWTAFKDTYKISELSRVGLRYINEITRPEGDPLAWEGYIHDDIVKASLGSPQPENHKLTRSMHAMFWIDDDHRITFQFGIQNSDFPNPIAKKEFMLDYDCSSMGPTEISEVVPCFEKYNKMIESLFESSIEEELRNLMNSNGSAESSAEKGD